MTDRIPVESIKVPKNKTYAFFYIVVPLIGPLLQKWENILTPLNGGCGGQRVGVLNPSFASKASGVVPSKTKAKGSLEPFSDTYLAKVTFLWFILRSLKIIF